jgi:hypothetical protein
MFMMSCSSFSSSNTRGVTRGGDSSEAEAEVGRGGDSSEAEAEVGRGGVLLPRPRLRLSEAATPPRSRLRSREVESFSQGRG